MSAAFPTSGRPARQRSRTPRGESVYLTLFRDVVTGRIPPEAHLVEQALADRFSVSRISVREAIRELEKHGLVEVIPNRGAFTMRFGLSEVEEIFSLREVLEVLAARLAAKRRTRADLALLDDISERMLAVEASGDRLLATEVDSDFHHALMRISRHGHALHAWESISAPVSMVVFNTTLTYSAIEGLSERHRPIIDAIASGDPEQAARVVSEHIRSGCDHLLEALRAQQGSGEEDLR